MRVRVALIAVALLVGAAAGASANFLMTTRFLGMTQLNMDGHYGQFGSPRFSVAYLTDDLAPTTCMAVLMENGAVAGFTTVPATSCVARGAQPAALGSE